MAQKCVPLQASSGYAEMKAIVFLNLRPCTQEKCTHIKYMEKEKAVLEGGSSLVPQWYTSSHLQNMESLSTVSKRRKAVAGMQRTQGSNFKLLHSEYVQKSTEWLLNIRSGLWQSSLQKTCSFSLLYSDTCSLNKCITIAISEVSMSPRHQEPCLCSCWAIFTE